MILSIQGWQFDVDLIATMTHSAAETADHCRCGYCRNFYSAVDAAYPDLRPFLGQFGVDIEGPSELLPFTPMVYLAGYLVKGTILNKGITPIRVDGVPVTAEVGEEQGWFRLVLGELELPWVLTEPMDEVESPANDPEFLQMMVTLRLSRFQDDLQYS